MQEIKVKKINDKLCVVLPPEYKEPYWLDFMYKDKYTKMDDGSIIIPCRDCNVTITKPVLTQTSMGMMQTQQSYVENWTYFDVPEVSALVKDGENLLDLWSLDKLKLELKEVITDETKEGEKNEN